MLCLRRRIRPGAAGEVVTEVTLDHELLMSSLHTDSERALATAALAMHDGEGLRVLIGGLGLGYTAEAALRSPRVAQVVVVEFLPEVIRWMREGLVPLAEALGADPRLAIEQGDVYARLTGPAARTYDLVLIDVDHSPDEPLAAAGHGFHTADGIARAQAHLAPGGVLAVWSSARDAAFERALQETFRDVRVEAVEFDNRHVGARQSDWIFLARHGGG